jgi:hypothetical protein
MNYYKEPLLVCPRRFCPPCILDPGSYSLLVALHCKKVSDFPVPSLDVTKQTLPGRSTKGSTCAV